MSNNLPPTSKRRLKLFLKTGGAIGLGLSLLTIVGLAGARWWAKDHLAPIVAKELSKSLKRPVNAGEIEDIWLNEVRISNAKIPPHGSDLSQLDVSEIVVNFNPIQVLINRTLKLDVRIVSPSLYLPQDRQGNWVKIPPQPKTPPGAIKVEVGSIKVENAIVALLPFGKNPQPVTLSKLNLDANIDDGKKRVEFNGGGQFQSIGQVQIRGNSSIANGETQLAVNGQKLDAAAATRVVKIPEVEIAQGTVDGNLNLAILPQKYLRINSKLLVRDGRVIINNVPRSLDAINGSIEVSEREVKFKNVSTKYDRVAGIVNGSLNYYTGYQLTAKTAAVSLPDVFKSIDVKSPFPLAGAAVADLTLTGKLDRPILAGKFNNSQPSQVDRVRVDRVNGNFKLADGKIKLDAIAQPNLGGKVTTNGEIQLLKTPQTRFQVQATDLPGDTLTRLYGAKLPPQVRLGTASVSGTIGGTGADIQTNLRVNTPQSTYPGKTDLQITPTGKTILRGATFAAAGGKVNVTGEVTAKDWRLNLQPQALDTRKLAKIAGVNLPNNYVGKLGGNIQAAGANSNVELEGIQARGGLNLQLAAGQIQANSFTLDRGKWQANVSSDRLNLQSLDRNLPAGIASGNFDLAGNGVKQIKIENIGAKGSGKVELKAGAINAENLTIANGNWQGLFTTENLKLSELNDRAPGKLSGKFNLAGNLQKFTPESIRGVGTGSVDLPQGKIVGDRFQIDRGKWQGHLRTSALVLGGLAPEIPLKLRTAKLAANVNVAGNLQQVNPENITIVGDGKLSLADGNIVAKQLTVESGKWRGNFAIDRLKLGSVSEEVPPEIASTLLTGNFAAAGELSKFSPDRVRVIGNGDLTLADGKIRANNLSLERGNWSSNLAIDNLKLGNFNRQLSPQLQASKLSGSFDVNGKVDSLKSELSQATGNGKLKLPNGGEINASNFQSIAGQWQSDLAIRKLQLGSVNQDLPTAIQVGLLSGNIQANGSLDRLEADRIRVNGNANITNVLGGNISLNNLALNNGQWQSQVIADRLNLAELSKFAPKNNNFDPNLVAGQLQANWQIDGNLRDNSLTNLRILGQTKLTDFRVGTLKFDPNLNGNIQANPGQGVDIDFSGARDKLALSLDRNLQLASFVVDRQGVIAKGNVTEEILSPTEKRRLLDINVERLPIAYLQQLIPESAGIGQYRLSGTATGNVAVNLNNYQLAGKQIEIIDPTFGAFQGDRLLANFGYANGKLNLSNTEIQKGANTYLINANIEPGAATPTFDAKLQVAKGSLEDIRNLAQVFSNEDLFIPLNQRKYGTVADLYPKGEKIANRPQPLYNELRRLSELRRWLNREANRQEANNPIPSIGNLEGDFSGDISIANSPKTGLTADFNVNGANWQLENYHIDRLQAKGNWKNGEFNFAPLALTIDNSQMNLAGKIGANNQDASIKVQNFPAQWLNGITQPLEIDGGIYLAAQIGGNANNPQIEGNLVLHEGQLNKTKLQYAGGNFNYTNGRLNFASDATFIKKLMPDREDRIKIGGSIPYQIPFTKAPESNAIKIDLSLDNQGLQMLDVFSKQQLHWIDGQGKVALKIEGKMKPTGEVESLWANGTATIANGKIQSIALPEPLTDINGQIVFDFDRIEVQKLAGKLQRGQITAMGILPISDSFSIEPTKQLNILLAGIGVNLPDKYNGGVDGNLTVLGTAFKPILTGELKLSNGQVSLADAPNTTATILGVKPLVEEDDAPNSSVQLRKLQLTLGDNLQIVRAPLLNFIATGKLDIDGTIDNPRPFGQVQLLKGSVNLFTTQFRLASGPQTADFFPTFGTEPVLNLRLYSKILQSNSTALTQRNSIAQTNNNEINQPEQFYTTSLGSVQTVQVEARIAGLASQVTQRLELTSTPSLSQAEILLLLGGGLVEQIGSGENIGLGIVNLAGSNILNTIQDRISDVLSLSDFRLFPTIISDAKTRSSSTFGIAAEVGTDIAPNLSTSVFKILTNSESLYYSLRYRLNDRILLRGSTNLYGENRAIIEFEQRF